MGVQEVPLADVSKYGIVDGEKLSPRLYHARNLIEKPGKGGEIQLTDGLLELSKIQEIIAYKFRGRRYDVGDKLGFIKANIEYGLRQDELSVTLKNYLCETVKKFKL